MMIRLKKTHERLYSDQSKSFAESRLCHCSLWVPWHRDGPLPPAHHRGPSPRQSGGPARTTSGRHPTVAGCVSHPQPGKRAANAEAMPLKERVLKRIPPKGEGLYPAEWKETGPIRHEGTEGAATRSVLAVSGLLFLCSDCFPEIPLLSKLEHDQ